MNLIVDASAEDSEARRAIREDLDVSLFVEASAGTGKTTELVQRMVAVLASGRTTVDRVAAVTFTRKAAGELKLRVRAGLDAARRTAADDTTRAYLDRAITHIEEASIGTIHGFAAELLRSRPIEARVDPDFVELSEDVAPIRFREAFRRWFEGVRNQPGPGLARILRRPTQNGYDASSGLVEQLEREAAKLSDWRDFPSPWRETNVDLKSAMDATLCELRKLHEYRERAEKPEDGLLRALAPVGAFMAWLATEEQVDAHSLESQLFALHSEMGRTKNTKGVGVFAKDLERSEVIRQRDVVLLALETLKKNIDGQLAGTLRGELWGAIEAYEALKLSRGELDFQDLLLKVRDVLSSNQGVRETWQNRFSHLFVDEFQDTDPLQSEILLMLSADSPDVSHWRNVRPQPGKLFVVGDPKQSIYRFRRADMETYQEARDHLSLVGVRVLRLSRSFRASASLQAFVNASFQGAMQEDRIAGQPSYVPITGGDAGSEEQIQLVALPVPYPYGRHGVTKTHVQRCLPDAVGALVDELLRQGQMTVRDPETPTRRVPLAPEHIAILFRRYTHFGENVTYAYGEALSQRNIRYVVLGSSPSSDAEELGMMRAALWAVENPLDQLSVYALFRGPLFSILDEVLFRFQQAYREFDPFDPQPAEDNVPAFQPVVEALDLLRTLHASRNTIPVTETVRRLLDATRAHVHLALRPQGHEALANIDLLLNEARRFDRDRSVGSFGTFVRQQDGDKSGLASRKSPADAGARGVRMLTVHGAKGLEFPVVILADMTAHLTGPRPDRTLDLEARRATMRLMDCTPYELQEAEGLEHRRDEAEGVRVAYVAATRARDVLVVPVLGEKPLSQCLDRPSWLAPLEEALYPPREAYGAPIASEGLSLHSVCAGSEEHPERLPNTVRPGRHVLKGGSYSVHWWDPSQLGTAPVTTRGLRQESFLQEIPETSDRVRTQVQDWLLARGRAIEQGEEQSVTPLRASDTYIEPPDANPLRLQEIHLARPKERSSGPRFGTLVHRVLMHVPLTADADVCGRLATALAKGLACPESEIHAAAACVRSALESPLFDRVRAASKIHREWPVILATDTGETLDGSIDLAFLEDDRWILVDYKTDLAPQLRQEAYRRQMLWYLHAIHRLTSLPANGILLHL
jgi:ATP-dependent helicase/nuclease subunit A